MKSFSYAAMAALVLAGTANAVKINPKVATAEGVSNFGFSLFTDLASKPSKQPVAISPLCIAEAMGLAVLGAEKETLAELEALFFKPSIALTPGTGKATLASGLKQIRTDLNDYSSKSKGNFEFASASTIWGNSSPSVGFEFKPNFVKTATTDFGAEVQHSDFSNKATVGEVNAWVESKTKNKIKDLITELTNDDVALLINAIYTKGKFSQNFNSSEQGEYTNAAGTKVPATLMNLKGYLNYHQDGDVKIVSLPIGDAPDTVGAINDQVALDVLVADDGKLSTLLSKLNGEDYKIWTRSLKGAAIDLTMPAGKIEQAESVRLKPNLQGSPFNVTRSFSDAEAQFSLLGSVSNGANLFINDVLTKTFYEVTPFGFEAAAATAVIMARETSAPVEPEYEKININGPSVHVIRHVPTGTPLFISVYDTPVEYTQDELVSFVEIGQANSRWFNARTKDGLIAGGWDETGGQFVGLFDEDGKVIKVLKKIEEK